jgi:hypothetical protein
MFPDIDSFTRILLSRTPSVGLVSWENVQALDGFVNHFGTALRANHNDSILTQLCGTDLDGKAFLEKLIQVIDRKNAARTCLLIYRIEELLGGAACVLNGNRERLGALRACVLAVRRDRIRDLSVAAPDLLDWIGLTIARAEDVGPPLTLRMVKASIKAYEDHYGIKSPEFLERWRRRDVANIADAWLWKESLRIKEELKKGESEE